MGDRPETFRSSGAVVVGGITVVVSLVLAVLAALHPSAGAPDWISAGLFLFAVLVYLAQVRPAVVLRDAHLVLRNMVGSVHVPLAAVKDVRVRQFLSVEVGRRTYDCAAVGRTRRQIAKDARHTRGTTPASWQPGDSTGSWQPSSAAPAELSYGRFIETKILQRATAARVDRGIEHRSEEQDALADDVRTVWAWPEIALLSVAVLLLAVTIVV